MPGLPPENQYLTRDQFRELTFLRDSHTCVVPGCGKPAQDAHHIVERRLWTGALEGGYLLGNGASVCGEHHLECERTTISVEAIRQYAGIQSKLYPPEIEPPTDKWGNPLLEGGKRGIGPLFFDPSVQKVLGEGGLLHDGTFVNRTKYGRTPHLPWSPGVTRTHGEPDDVVLEAAPWRDGEPIVVTEKMDGSNCLEGNTKITMADGSLMRIRHIVDQGLVGNYVLGVNEAGQIVPSRVLAVFDNGKTQDWRRVYVKGSHGTSRTIVCTPEHRFCTDEAGYIDATDLRVGMHVSVLNQTLPLSFVQEQVLLGKLLGDGSLNFPYGLGAVKNNTVASVSFNHIARHREYVEWTMKALGSLTDGKTVSVGKSGYGSDMLSVTTTALHSIYERFASMVSKGCKWVPSSVMSDITPLCVAFWYMDDGSLAHSQKQTDRCQFSVCGFADYDCWVLAGGLARLGVEAAIRTYDGERYLDINAVNTERLATLIAPYVPPSMQYKLPEAFRGGPGWLPKSPESVAQPWLRSAEVIRVEPTECRSPVRSPRQFDLQTETGNYFANSMLVHNCTMYYGNDQVHARSLDGRSHAWMSYVKSIQARIAWDIPQNFRIVGENVQAVHSLRYYDIPPFLVFAIFEATPEGWWALGWDEVVEWTALLGLRTVPVLFEGPWNERLIRTCFDWHQDDPPSSVYGPEREGYVVRTAGRFAERELVSHAAKFVRPGHVTTDRHWAHRPVQENNLVIV